MSAAEQYAERIDAVAAQRARVIGERAVRDDRWTGATARRFRADPRRELDPVLSFVASQVQPDDVFLDVGGGAGRIGFPIALRCRETIIVDPSAGIRAEFDELATESSVKNIRFILESWPPSTRVAGDMAFASNVTYFVRNIVPFVQGMHDAARRRVALMIGSVPPPNMNAKLFRLVYGEDQALVPGQAELLPVLWELGLVPEIRVLAGAVAIPQPPMPERDEAVQFALTSVDAADKPGARDTVQAHFDDLFGATPAGYVAQWRPESKTVFITWEK